MTVPSSSRADAAAPVTALHNDMLRRLQRNSFDYFVNEINRANGLVLDKTCADWPASIAAIGMALTVYPVGVARGFIERAEAAQRTLTTLRFLAASEQSESPDATGYKGFYYHFLDMQTGRRVWHSELSSIDTALLIAGVLAAATYFDGPSGAETEIRDLGKRLYERIDWAWMLNGGDDPEPRLAPRAGLSAIPLGGLRRGADPLPARHRLADAPDRSGLLRGLVPQLRMEERVTASTTSTPGRSSSTRSRTSGATFAASATASCASTTATTSRTAARATFVQQQYAIRNPLGFKHVNELCWGITASDGPGFEREEDRRHRARLLRLRRPRRALRPRRRHAGAVGGRGLAAVRARDRRADASPTGAALHVHVPTRYGFKASFNPVYHGHGDDGIGWVSPLPLRHQRRADRADDRELPQRA